jgi:hypothetical protein
MDIIRKIIIGRDPKDGMAYFVGMRAGTGTISNIVFDEKEKSKNGNNVYHIYITNEDESIVRWKKIENCPVIIENDCKF